MRWLRLRQSLSSMTIAYDAGELNEVSILMKWRGTIMPMVLTRA